jgi:hypothetical protein
VGLPTVDYDDRIGRQDPGVIPGDLPAGSQCLVARDAERVGCGGFRMPGRLVHIHRTHIEGESGGAQELGAAR